MIDPAHPRPLDGVRVLELANNLPGPFCTRLLADMGAEVIKIEDPASGDPARWMTPLVGDHSAAFALLNHGKKALTLNLKDPAGQEVFEQLAALSEVIVEGYRPGVADRLGIGYKRLSKIHTGIIYCSISGYGQDGRDAQSAGHDLNYLARSGILSLTTDAQGSPVIPCIQIGDLVSGIYAATSILAALRLRDTTGHGQYCDISMLRSLLSLMTVPAAAGLGRDPVEPGSHLQLSGKLACYNVYRTADGRFVTLGAWEPKFWTPFCARVGHPEWTEWQFQDARQEELKSALASLFGTRLLDDWLCFFADDDVCLEPVWTLNEVLRALGNRAPLADAEHILARASSLIRFPVDFSSSAAHGQEQPNLDVPLMGAHNEEVLQLLGYSEQEMDGFRARGVIAG